MKNSRLLPHVIKGACLEYFPANTLVWAGGNINGKGIYDLLCENPTIKQALDNSMLPIDIEGIFSSIHGDVAVGYNSLSNNDLLIYADVTNKRLFAVLRRPETFVGYDRWADAVELYG